MPDWDADGWLDGLSSEARAERVQLLDWLVDEGFGEDELRQAHEAGLLPFLPAERVVMGGAPVHTSREIAAAAKVDLELIQRFRQAQGLTVPGPDDRVLAESEAAIAALPVGFRELGFTDDQMLAIVRVLGRGLAQTAQTMRAAALEASLAPGRSERELAEAYRDTVASVMPYLPALLNVLLRQHLREMVREEGLDAAERRSGRPAGARDTVVAFADLVGFTRLGEAVEPEALSEVADRLGRLATDVARPPVRMVKQLGDGVMLASAEAGPLLDACFALAATVEAEGLPELRIGIASGPAVHRGGDLYGRPVNLASRLSSLARAGSTLTTEEVHDVLPDAARWSFAGERKVKGVGAVKVWRARRPGEGP